MVISVKCTWTRTRLWLVATVAAVAMVEVLALSGPNVCMVKQKYNITKRIKYRAPMSVRTYEWCFSMPPRCSKWNTEMRDLTRLETEERTAEVAVCCPGYKMKDVSCVPICPHGKTGPGCSEDCQPNRWGPNCVNECKDCSEHGVCSPVTGECVCQDGWQGESCETMSTTTTTTTTTTTPAPDLLTFPETATKPSAPSTTAFTLITTSTSTVAPTTMRPTTSMITTSTVTTQRVPMIPKKFTSTTKQMEITTATLPMETTKTRSTYRAVAPEVEKQMTFGTFMEETTQRIVENSSIYNRTDKPLAKESTYPTEIILPTTQSTSTIETTNATVQPYRNTTIHITTTQSSKSTFPMTVKDFTTTSTVKLETTRKQETTLRSFLTTQKFKPKEIWIRPAQKGETSVTEIKTKLNHEPVKYKNATKIEIIPNTTPKTIIVSIIPTSVSYATFKKISLTTASFLSHKNMTVIRSYNKSQGSTKPMSLQASTVISSTISYNKSLSNHFTTNIPISRNMSKPTAPHFTSAPPKGVPVTTSVFVNNITNRMARTVNAVPKILNSSNYLTTPISSSTNSTLSPQRYKPVEITTSGLASSSKKGVTIGILNKNAEIKENSANRRKEMKATTVEVKTTPKVDRTNNTKVHVEQSNSKTNTVTTDKPQDEETFHILTEPEHITAVMSEKGTERSSIDLISVISIVGGVMMAVITVAVIIVMMERCKKPRYEDVRKINDIRMQVMIDNNDVPPPYVRSIFHTPLPDPPKLEKCHYQPISTLDRNLKQFMRPVVVQTISPMMLENFRGILECHYDHLPRRSHDFGPPSVCCSVTPSIAPSEQLLLQRVSLTESAIDAMKCEAKLDVIDNTTSEPLYAEIPCWRPPSEHAIEIINTNGEAVTEL